MSVPCSLVVTCWERADLLAVMSVVFCHFPKCSGPHQNQGQGCRLKTGLSPPVKYFTDHFKVVLPLWIICVSCLVFAMLWRLFIAAFYSPAGKELTFWLLFVMFNVYLSLSHVVSWSRCGTWLYRFLICAIFLTMWSSGQGHVWPKGHNLNKLG